MNSSKEECNVESFLKINTIWSEADENFMVKEEIVSDIEPEYPGDNEQEFPFANDSENILGNHGNNKTTSCESDDKKRANDDAKLNNDKSRTNDSQTLICSHDVQNFKVVRRKLRCGDCKSLVCPECYRVVVFTLQSHLSGSDTNSVTVYSCKMCHLNFHTLCALQAHIRVHAVSTPYVCPDCGLLYNNINFLILHLINKCYHVYKTVRYKCKCCPDMYFNHEMFVQHIQLQHMESLFRCSYCSSLFSNSEEFKQHMSSVHQKQKLQYLSYFLCSLCSDMVIPRFMLEKHIFQHCNNIDSYEMNYQCICGCTYSLLGAFRAHIQDCNKKKILPSKWSFLHKKLNNQELFQEDSKQSSHTTYWSTNSTSVNIESHMKSSNLLKPPNKNNSIKQSKSENSEVLEKNSGNVITENSKGFSIPISKENVTEVFKKDDSETDARITIGLEGNTSESNSEMNSLSRNVITQSEIVLNETVSNLNYQKSGNFVKTTMKSKINELPYSQSDKDLDDEISSGIKCLNDENQNNSEALLVINNNKDVENPDLSKTFYNHIPCDHLGYVSKTQSSESIDKDLEINETICSSTSKDKSSKKKFNLVEVLDEKTGLLSIKNVPVENVNEVECRKQENFKWNDEIQDTIAFNVEPKSVTCGKVKSKLKLSGVSFFTCPFCVVKFQKYKAAFHQFKLHMESYHPDAALGITVVDEENEKLENCPLLLERDNITLKYFDDIESESNVKDEIKSMEDKLSRHPILKFNDTINQTSIKATDEEVSNSDKESWLESNQNSSNEYDDLDADEQKEKIVPQLSSYEKRTFYEDEKENVSSESNIMLKASKEIERKDLCWTVNISFPKNKEKTPDLEGTNKISTNSCISTVKTSGSNESRTRNFEEEDFKASEEHSTITFTKQADLKEKPNFIEVKKLPVTGEKENFTPDENSKNQKDDDHVFNNENPEKNENEKMIDSEAENVIRNEKTLQISLDFDEDYNQVTKESNSSTGFLHSERIDNVSKYEEKEKSRRESEVWSEFYESLMLAEKLKKKKEKKYLGVAEELKMPLVSDYSTKRIVKKPKRFRESSESGGSGGENENSDSDAEFIISNSDFVCDLPKEEAGETEKRSEDDESKKRETILNKLQKIDTRLLDYLFELVIRKEKNVDFRKRNPSPSINHYGQDLRSYRKKVLNGIKQRGRPHKLLRYQELLNKKDASQSLLNKEVVSKEINQQGIQKKISNFSLVINKTGEKKRGRPRKIVDSSKIKKRRRSDKEVNFIEKNFEREENDLSPSKRKRKLSSKLQYYKTINLTDDRDDFSSGQVITNKPLDSSKIFSCAVCKEVFPAVTEFRDHILVHRMEENSYQCMECGECFVVRPSLEKHLHAFHKIKNTEKYIMENECCNIKKETVEPEDEPLKENQCKVCKDQFDRAIDLTKHFRIHGMAFLKEFKKEGKK